MLGALCLAHLITTLGSISQLGARFFLMPHVYNMPGSLLLMLKSLLIFNLSVQHPRLNFSRKMRGCF